MKPYVCVDGYASATLLRLGHRHAQDKMQTARGWHRHSIGRYRLPLAKRLDQADYRVTTSVAEYRETATWFPLRVPFATSG
jgi:hypothetical protein